MPAFEPLTVLPTIARSLSSENNLPPQLAPSDPSARVKASSRPVEGKSCGAALGEAELEGEVEAEGLILGDSLLLGLTLELGDTEGLSEEDGDTELLGLILGDSLAEGDCEPEGESDGEGEDDGLPVTSANDR